MYIVIPFMLKFIYTWQWPSSLITNCERRRASDGSVSIIYFYIRVLYVLYLHICELIQQFVVALSDIPRFYYSICWPLMTTN